MPTIVVNNQVRFKNMFSAFGRKQNSLYEKLGEFGCSHIRQRNLPNKKVLISGYKNSTEESSNVSILLSPDLTMLQKTNDVISHSLREHVNTICKVFIDKTGKALNIKTKTRVKGVDGNLIRAHEVEANTEGVISNKKYSRHGFATPNMLYYKSTKSTLKVTEKAVQNGSYALLEHADGSKTYIKNVNGQIYTFATA